MVKHLKHAKNLLQEFSIPLILGVITALAWANLNHESYRYVMEVPWTSLLVFGHPINLKFASNEILMVFFFGIAAKEITESLREGGDLHPVSKAMNPLLATAGGVIVPALTCAGLIWFLYGDRVEYSELRKAWAIPTATDIALAWLAAKMIFGATHSAVKFLLLLAIADDAAGLGILAAFYPDPLHPVHAEYLLLVVVGMGACWIMRTKQVQSWVPYVLIGGTLSWLGLINASLHPALALVPIVPFMPPPNIDTGLYESEDEVDRHLAPTGQRHSTLHQFESYWKTIVDFGLFFFALCNAGVPFGQVNQITAVILFSLIAGKTVGVTLMSWLGTLMGYPLPRGMEFRHLLVAGMIAGIGLTVSLFVSSQAFAGTSPHLGPAKMGAVLSVSAILVAWLTSKALRIKPI